MGKCGARELNYASDVDVIFVAEPADEQISEQAALNLATKLAACAGGNGIAQTIELGLAPLLESGNLVQVLPDWAEEHFPLFAYYPSRHLPPAKVRAFVDFVVESVAA